MTHRDTNMHALVMGVPLWDASPRVDGYHTRTTSSIHCQTDGPDVTTSPIPYTPDSTQARPATTEALQMVDVAVMTEFPIRVDKSTQTDLGLTRPKLPWEWSYDEIAKLLLVFPLAHSQDIVLHIRRLLEGTPLQDLDDVGTPAELLPDFVPSPLPWGWSFQQFYQLLQAHPMVHPEDIVSRGFADGTLPPLDSPADLKQIHVLLGSMAAAERVFAERGLEMLNHMRALPENDPSWQQEWQAFLDFLTSEDSRPTVPTGACPWGELPKAPGTLPSGQTAQSGLSRDQGGPIDITDSSDSPTPLATDSDEIDDSTASTTTQASDFVLNSCQYKVMDSEDSASSTTAQADEFVLNSYQYKVTE